MLSKSIDWFLYDNNLGLSWVDIEVLLLTLNTEAFCQAKSFSDNDLQLSTIKKCIIIPGIFPFLHAL